jgi:hypothetical protein
MGGGGKEIKMNSGSATANQMRDGGKSETKAFANRERYKKYLLTRPLLQCNL